MDRRGWELFIGEDRCPVCGGGEETGCRRHDGSLPAGGGAGGKAWAGRVWCQCKTVPTPQWRVVREADEEGAAAPEGQGVVFAPVVAGKMADGSAGAGVSTRTKGGAEDEAFRAAARREAAFLWERAAQQLGHEHVAAYVRGRGLDPDALAEDLATLGYIADHEIVVPVERDGVEQFYKARGPVLFAACRDLRGSVIGVQRIMLDAEGTGAKRAKPEGWPADEKWDVKRAKGSAGSGGAIWLGWSDGESTVVLCEGLETGLAIRQATGLPVWVCVSTTGLKNVELPASVKTVVIAADNDTKKAGKVGPGEKVAIAKAEELRAKRPGIVVGVCMPGPEVAPMLFDEAAVPKVKGCDWLDVLIAAGPEAVVRAIEGRSCVVEPVRKDATGAAATAAIAASNGEDPKNIADLLGGTGEVLTDAAEVPLARHTLFDLFGPMLGERVRADERWPLVRHDEQWLLWRDGKGSGATCYRPVTDEQMFAMVGRHMQTYRRMADGVVEALNPGKKTIGNAVELIKMQTLSGAETLPAWLHGSFLPSGQPDWTGVAVLEDADAGRTKATDIFAVPEGLLDLAAWQRGSVVIHKHTPRWMSTTCSPVSVPWAQVKKALMDEKGGNEKQIEAIERLAAKMAPTWAEFLTKSLPDRVDRRLLQTFYGYCLTSDMRYEKFLAFIGPSGSGKSTAMEPLQVILGEAAVYTMSLTDLQNQFALAGIIGKNVVVMPDEAKGSSTDMAMVMSQLAKWVGRDTLNSDRKFKSRVTFKPTAKLVVSFNELPSMPDAAGKLERRMLPLEFGSALSEAERRRDLKDKWPEEAAGILLWALAGLRRLHMQAGFELSTGGQIRLRDYQEQNAPVLQFVREVCETLVQVRAANKALTVEEAKEVRVPKKVLHAVFNAWAEKNDRHTLPDSTFAERLRAAVPGLTDERRAAGNTGKRPRDWLGLRLTAEGLALVPESLRPELGMLPHEFGSVV